MEPDENSEKLKYISDGEQGFIDITFVNDGDGEVSAYIEGRGFHRAYLKACPKCNCVQLDRW